MLDFKWAIINNSPLRTIADSLVKGLRMTEALPVATRQIIHYFCYSAIEDYFLKVLKSINQFLRNWSGPGLAKTLRSERGEMTHYECTSGHGASKRLIFWFFMSYFIEGQGKTDKDNRMSSHMTKIPFPVLYQCRNALKRAKTTKNKDD